jgi:putative toxin-antitoxin system antitoxin component (TIGR02293 family)
MATAIPTTPDENAPLLRLLGGRRALGSTPRNDADYIELVRRGLPFPAFQCVTSHLDLSLKDVQDFLRLSGRTLYRRKDQRLDPFESERVMRLARVASRALKFFGHRDRALHWLTSPNRALLGEKPLTLLDTDLGASQVLEVLGRLEFSIYT